MEQLQQIKVTPIEARLLREFVRGPDFFRRMLLDMFERCLYSARKAPPQEETTVTVEAGTMEQRLILEYRATNDYGKLTMQEILLPRLHGEPPYTLNGKRLMRRSTWETWMPDLAYEREQGGPDHSGSSCGGLLDHGQGGSRSTAPEIDRGGDTLHLMAAAHGGDPQRQPERPPGDQEAATMDSRRQPGRQAQEATQAARSAST